VVRRAPVVGLCHLCCLVQSLRKGRLDCPNEANFVVPRDVGKSHINTFMRGGRLVLLASKIALVRLRAVVRSLGKDALSFDDSEVGNHSLRSAAAMAMYLAGVPVYTIMLNGRLSSDAFLRYIRRQVQAFSAGVSRRMILAPDFLTIPDEVPQHSSLATRLCSKSQGQVFWGATYTSFQFQSQPATTTSLLMKHSGGWTGFEGSSFGVPKPGSDLRQHTHRFRGEGPTVRLIDLVGSRQISSDL
jgi:hypothetical protein